MWLWEAFKIKSCAITCSFLLRFAQLKRSKITPSRLCPDSSTWRSHQHGLSSNGNAHKYFLPPFCFSSGDNSSLSNIQKFWTTRDVFSGRPNHSKSISRLRGLMALCAVQNTRRVARCPLSSVFFVNSKVLRKQLMLIFLWTSQKNTRACVCLLYGQSTLYISTWKFS